MADFTLTYFDFPGSRGEECRLAFALAGVPFDDDRVAGPSWAERKPEMPFGAMPVLTEAGKGRLSQTNAILVYLGRRFDLHPSDPWLAAKHEELMCACEELRTAVGITLRVTEPGERQAKREELARTTIPAWGANMRRLFTPAPFVGGEKLHVVDLKIYMLLKWFKSGVLDHIPAGVLDDVRELVTVHDAVRDHPVVAARHAPKG